MYPDYSLELSQTGGFGKKRKKRCIFRIFEGHWNLTVLFMSLKSNSIIIVAGTNRLT